MHRGGVGGARIALQTELFASLLSSEEASDIVDSLAQENVSRGKSPDLQISIVILGDQYIKHRSSGKQFEVNNPLLWRSKYIHRFDFS